jgi:hypothetical protein
MVLAVLSNLRLFLFGEPPLSSFGVISAVDFDSTVTPCFISVSINTRSVEVLEGW